MARRLRWLQAAHSALDHTIDIPALLVTGEAELERVVPPSQTVEYLSWLPHASVVTLQGTGHGGTVTRSREFAALVGKFAVEVALGAPMRAGTESRSA
jgi:pimeloyl-ACP methyl ester carboxylesterase